MFCASFWRSGHEPDQRLDEEDEEFIKRVGGFVHPGVDVPWIDVGECDIGFATGEFLKNIYELGLVLRSRGVYRWLTATMRSL